MGLFPGSVDSLIRAEVYGPLPDHGNPNVALVLHTTETRGMPRYRYGETAPHYTFNPKTLTFHQHAEFEDGYVGTLKGHKTGGHGNCKAFQVEMITYSSWPAAQSVGGLWIGDWTDEMYAKVSEFVGWARARYGITDEVTKEPVGGWLAGTGSPHRLTTEQWKQYGGLTAHGAVPLNSHWDTGVLDLERVSRGGGTAVFTAWSNEMFDLFTDKEIQDLYDAGYIEGNESQVVPYFAALRDLGAEGRDAGQRKEIARLIQTSTVSGWLAAAN